MRINSKEVIGKYFTYDGCHKIYIIEDEQDRADAQSCGYDIYPIIVVNAQGKQKNLLKEVFRNSCGLRFISNWKLDTAYVPQGTRAIFDK